MSALEQSCELNLVSKVDQESYLLSRYYKVLKKIFHQKSPSKIQSDYDEAICLHSLEASGNSYFQLFTQLQLMVLLVALGAGTLVDGVDVNVFFKNIGESKQFAEKQQRQRRTLPIYCTKQPEKLW